METPMEFFEIPFGDGWCVQFEGRYAEPSDDDDSTVVLIPAPEPPRDD